MIRGKARVPFLIALIVLSVVSLSLWAAAFFS
jgi:hypothetical protein